MEGNSRCGFLKRHGIMLSVVVGAITGFCLGFGVRGHADDVTIMWLGLPGDVYMRLLKMTILPLVVSSIITGTSSLNAKSSGKIVMISMIYILVTNTAGAFLGIIIFYMFQLDNGSATLVSNKDEMTVNLGTSDMFTDLIRNIFPDNMVTACFRKSQTTYLESAKRMAVSETNFTRVVNVRQVGSTEGVNILGVMVTCTLFGLATTITRGHSKEIFLNFFAAVTDVVMVVLNWIIWFTCIGVASLVAASIASVSDIKNVTKEVGLFVLAHAVGNVILCVLCGMICYSLLKRANPLPFLFSCIKPLTTAIVPPSLAIAIPVMLTTLEREHCVDKRISRFFVPLGTALSRCGSCMFITLSVLFLASLEGKTMSVLDVIITGILTAVSSFAIPSVPSAAIIPLLIILSTLDVQVLSLGLLMAFEWLNNRVRTASNVIAMMFGGILLQHFCRKDLADLPENSHLDDCLNVPIDIAEDKEESCSLKRGNGRKN